MIRDKSNRMCPNPSYETFRTMLSVALQQLHDVQHELDKQKALNAELREAIRRYGAGLFVDQVRSEASNGR